MKAYDIILNADNAVEVNTYNVEIVRDKNKNSFYQFEIIDRQEVVDLTYLPEIIENLRQKGYFNISRLEPTAFILNEGSTIYNTLLAPFLQFRNKLLEMVYDEVVIDDMCRVFIYITYVNVKTGELYALKINDLGFYSKEIIKYLSDRGYKHIGNSFLGNYLDIMNSDERKPFVLNRKK